MVISLGALRIENRPSTWHVCSRVDLTSDSMMATKRQSAFAVYQQLKQEQEHSKIRASELEMDSEDSPEETREKGSRKRKRAVALKEKKRRKLADKSEEDIVKYKKSKKAKQQVKKSKKQSKSGKLKKVVLDNGATKKKKAIVSSRRKPGKKRDNSSEPEQDVSTENGYVDDGYDYDPTNVKQEDLGISGNGIEVPFRSQFQPNQFKDSRDAARELFRLVINPVSVDQFYEEIWEKKPLLIHRHMEGYNSGWFSTNELDSILRENDLEFGTNIDITSYEDGERKTYNPDGKAHASTVWDYFQGGCSVRLLNPATYSNSVRLLNSTLQEHFNSCVGANIYLTPAGSQGFAPHYDDIEAFVLQLEGRKHWRVYAPRTSEKMLPLYSSPNFSEDDDLGHLVIDTVLEPGDVLYFPRGFIHQANTLPDSHSLHITVSTYQKNTWGDLLEKLLPAALQIALTEDLDFRRGLPTECLNYMGIVNSDKDDPRRVEFCKKISELMSKLFDYAPIDPAVDQVAADHIHSSLPPIRTEEEALGTYDELGSSWNGAGVTEGITLTPQTLVKIIRYGVVRLVLEGEETTLYYSLQNSSIYREKDLTGMLIHEDDAPAVEFLINTYPEFVTINDLPVNNGSDEDKINLCHNLFSQGLLVIDDDH